MDTWLTNDGPAALVVVQPLLPVDGPDGIVFAPNLGDNLLIDGGGESACCTLASVAAEANRLEAILRDSGLIPAVQIRAGDEQVSICDLPFRAGDSLARLSTLGPDLAERLRQYQRGDRSPLTKQYPTTVLFGTWDSLGTQAKVPRIITSTIRAIGVTPVTCAGVRSSVDLPCVQAIPLAERKELLLQRIPYSREAGVRARAIRRETIISLVHIRRHGEMAERRYLLGLALIAATTPLTDQIRQRCLLVHDGPAVPHVVHFDGRRERVTLTDPWEYAQSAAAEYGIGPELTGEFVPPQPRKKGRRKKADQGESQEAEE